MSARGEKFSDEILHSWEREERKTESEELAEAEETIRIYSGLVESEGWKKLVEFAEDTVDKIVQPHIRQPLESLHELPKAEFRKGRAAGMSDLTELPYRLISEAKTLIEMIEKEREDGGRDEV